MFKATRMIQNGLADGIGQFCQIQADEDRSSIEVPLPVEGTSLQRLQFISTDDDNDVAVRLFQLISNVPDDKRPSVLDAVNECNATYRYTKFVLDDDGDVNVEYDYPLRISDEDLPEITLETLARFSDILKDAYKILMRAMWA